MTHAIRSATLRFSVCSLASRYPYLYFLSCYRLTQSPSNMRRSVQSTEDPEVTKALKFSIGSDEDEAPAQKPPLPIFRHISDTHPPPTYAHVRIVRFLIRTFPKVLVFLLVAFLFVILLPGGWRVALCSANLLPPPSLRPKENITLIAHRGCEFPYPENSLHALRFGADQLQFVELDIGLSSDGQVVVMHDDTLERTTNGTGLTCSRPLSYISQLELKIPQRDPRGKIAQAKFCADKTANGQRAPCIYRVPTLETILDELPDGTKFMIDVKQCYADGISVPSARCSNCTILMQRTRDLLEKYVVKPENVIFTSTETASLKVFQDGMRAGSKYALSMNAKFSHYKRNPFMEAFTEGNWNAAAMYVGLAAVRPDFVRLIRNSKVAGTSVDRDVYAWTIRRDLDYRMARCAGISNMIVAEPDKVKKRFAWDIESLLGEEP